jgi:hypothetical protein
MRKLAPSRYPKLIPEEFWKRVQQVASEVRPEFVFCNFGNFIPVATRLRQMMPKGVKLVLLSHGLASVDDLHRDRVAATSSFGKVHLKRLGPGLLGSALLTERKGLPIFDHVFCLAEFEVPINRWLGAHSVSWWPRTRPADQPVDWQPTGEFVGLLGTLDHPPNLEGIHLFCRALADRAGNGPKVRIVTRSSKVGEELAQAYAFVDHLGSLEDHAVLRSEVSRWNAFVHPIFCHAMGCSTKVAIGLGWGLPVLTSAAGVRGYRAGENVLRVAQSDTSGSGQTNISGFVGGATNDFAITAGVTATASVGYAHRFDIDLRGKRRYLTVFATPASTCGVITSCRLSKAEAGPTDATGKGVNTQAVG